VFFYAQKWREIKMPEIIQVGGNTKVEEVLEQLKSLKGNIAKKEEMQQLQTEFQEALEKRNADVDKQMGDLEGKMETKLAEMVDTITNTVKSVDYKNNNNYDGKYGKDFKQFVDRVKSRDMSLKDLSITDGSTGGYLVPEVFSNEILRVEGELAIVANSGARVIQMGKTNIMKFTALNQRSNANGSLFGGITTYWADCGEELTESNPKFKQISLEPKKIIGYCESDNELFDDSMVAVGGLLQDLYGEALAYQKDEAFLVGDGVGKPLGVQNAPCTVTVSRTTSSAVVTSDLINMMARFKGRMNRAAWVINQTVLPQLLKLKDENDNYIWMPGMSGNIAGNAPGTVYGLPIKVTDNLPALGTSGDIMLCDFGYYLIGQKQGLRFEESNHYKFNTDQLVMRMIDRVDGQPWLDGPIAPKNGDNLSPFVMIG
jgi:HK97 family phage major capsid protein